MKTYPVIIENIKSLFFDISLPIIVSLSLILNLFIAFFYHIFDEPPTEYPFWFMIFFDSMLFMIYGGYVGTKYFAWEFDKNTIIPLILTPIGKNRVYAGKIIALITVGVIISSIVFLQIILFLARWCFAPLIFLYWYGFYSLLLLFSVLFSMFIAVSFGVLIKRTGLTLLISSTYLIFSFFTIGFAPMEYVVDSRIFYTSIFPILGIWYTHLSLTYYALFPLLVLYLSFSGMLFVLAISYLLYKGVRL